MPYDLFISHSRREDAGGRITELKQRLEADYRAFAKEDLRCFFDREDIHGKDDWRQRIAPGLRESQLLLLVLSPGYLESPYCEWEIVEYLQRDAAGGNPPGERTPLLVVDLTEPGHPDLEQLRAWVGSTRRIERFDLRAWFTHGSWDREHPDSRSPTEVLAAVIREELWKRRPLDPVPPCAPPPNVQFSAYCPRSLPWFPEAGAPWKHARKLLVFAHLDDRPADAEDDALHPVEEMERMARHDLGERVREYLRTTRDASLSLPDASEITLRPEVPGCRFNPSTRSFHWYTGRDVHKEEFLVIADGSVPGGAVSGRIDVLLGVLTIASIRIGLRIESTSTIDTKPKEPAATRATPYRKIFASYSHRDLPIVEHIEQVIATLGDEFYRDLVHLRAGEVWQERLYGLIEAADLFQLFWSREAATSPFVAREWRHALRLGRPNFIMPSFWEDPMPAAPPELGKLHFRRISPSAVPTTQAAAASPAGWVAASGPRPPEAGPEVSIPRSPPAIDRLTLRCGLRRLHVFSGDRLTLGRSADADVPVGVSRVMSRQHGSLFWTHAGLRLVDGWPVPIGEGRPSQNGIWWRDSRVRGEVLAPHPTDGVLELAANRLEFPLRWRVESPSSHPDRMPVATLMRGCGGIIDDFLWLRGEVDLATLGYARSTLTIKPHHGGFLLGVDGSWRALGMEPHGALLAVGEFATALGGGPSPRTDSGSGCDPSLEDWLDRLR